MLFFEAIDLDFDDAKQIFELFEGFDGFHETLNDVEDVVKLNAPLKELSRHLEDLGVLLDFLNLWERVIVQGIQNFFNGFEYFLAIFFLEAPFEFDGLAEGNGKMLGVY